MLQSMRELAHSWVAKGVMLFLMVSFSIWGIGDIFRGNPQAKTVTKVGNSDISVQDLRKLFQDNLSQARERINPDLTEKTALDMGLLEKSLDAEIERRVVDQQLARLGINVSQDQVLKILAAQPQFRDKNGNFNKVGFMQLLAQQQLTEGGFIKDGQLQMARELLTGSISGSRMVPQTEIDAVYKARAQKRILDVVTIDEGKIGDVGAADDKALHAFYDAHQDMFMAPEYRAVTIATLSAATLADDIKISDDEVQKEYDAKSDALAHAEQRDIVQVVVPDEEKAKELVKQARASGDLKAAAAANKETAVPLDAMESANLMAELSKPVFALHANEVSDPVKTQLGRHVVQVKKITPAGKPGFAEIKEQLREEMKRDQAADAAAKTVNQLDDQLAAGHSLDDIANEMKLKLAKIPAVDAAGLMPGGKAVADLPNKEAVLKDAFGQGAGETSPVEDDKAGTYFVVRTDDITAAGAKPFDSVKTLVADAWKAQEQASKAKLEADKIEEALKAGKPVSAVADQPGVSVRTSTPLSQLGDSDALLPPELLKRAFMLKKGDVDVAESDKKRVVVRLAGIMDADIKDDPRRNQVAGELKRGAADELLTQYVAYLKQVFPVRIDAALLDTMRHQAD